MRHLLFSACFALLPCFCIAQDCTPAQYQKMLKEADQAVKRGEYDLAINKLQSAKVCQPGKEGEVSEKILKVFEKVNGERQQAIRQRERAEAEARRIYANDMAFKSQTALRDGDRTTAFRLAEMAHRYVDEDNPNVTRALVDALYYNDHPDHTHRLPWASNIEGHTQSINSVAFSPDGKRLATGSWDNTAKIWDLETGKAILTFEGHTAGVESVAFSSNGKYLATGSSDNTVKIWDVETGKDLTTLRGHIRSVRSVVFSQIANVSPRDLPTIHLKFGTREPVLN